MEFNTCENSSQRFVLPPWIENYQMLNLKKKTKLLPVNFISTISENAVSIFIKLKSSKKSL